MTRKDLREVFNFIGGNKDIALFYKDKSNCLGIGYCGNISLENGKAVFNGQKYKDIDSLKSALEEWADTLEFPVDTYCPLTNDVYRLESRLTWYLTAKLKYKLVHHGWNSSYEREIGPNCKIFFRVSRNHNDKIELFTQYGDYTFTKEINDVKDGINMMVSLTREFALSMASDIISIVSDCPDVNVTDIDAFVKANNLFGIKQTDYKSTMIDLLENELKKLKGE